MDKQFLTLLAATTARTEALNDAWKRVIGYAVKKAHSDRDTGLEYVQASLDSAPAGVRKAVASAFRQLNINVSALDRGQFKAEGIRSPKKQEEVFERVKTNDIPDVVQMADRLPKEKKADKREAEEIAADAIKRMLARLKETAPEAFAIANDRLTRVSIQARPNSLTIGNEPMDLTKEELAAALDAVTALRIEGRLRKAA